jgi:hypothetical protein
MKNFLLLLCLFCSLRAMDFEMEQVASAQFSELADQTDSLDNLINEESYELFCDAFSVLEVEKYHDVINRLKNYLEEDRDAHKEFVHECYAFMASFLRNQEKPEEMEDDLFSSTSLLNSDSFEELRQLLVNDDPYESEASIEPGSDSEEEY